MIEIKKQFSFQIDEDELTERIEKQIERNIQIKMDDIINNYINEYMEQYKNRQRIANVAQRMCEGAFVRELIGTLCNSRDIDGCYGVGVLKDGVRNAMFQIARNPEEYGTLYQDMVADIAKGVAQNYRGNKLKQLYAHIDNLVSEVKRDEEEHIN